VIAFDSLEGEIAQVGAVAQRKAQCDREGSRRLLFDCVVKLIEVHFCSTTICVAIPRQVVFLCRDDHREIAGAAGNRHSQVKRRRATKITSSMTARSR
jgi:hypothetical protein